jgi:hypothetical protein
LNDVCAALDSSHERDVRDEAPEATGIRLINFLAVLKFPLPPDNVYVSFPVVTHSTCVRSSWLGVHSWELPTVVVSAGWYTPQAVLQWCSFVVLACREPFRNALVAGDRAVIYPVLEYILARFPQLQKRTYLSKFLMAIDIPQDILFDECTLAAASRGCC